MKLTLATIAACLSLSCMAREQVYFRALSQLESGDNDLKRGKAFERGRYQCLQSRWIEVTTIPFKYATNHAIAYAVGREVIWHTTHKEAEQLTPEQFAIAWHRPKAHKMTPELYDYIKRFCNLVTKFQQQDKFYEQQPQTTNFDRRLSQGFAPAH